MSANCDRQSEGFGEDFCGNSGGGFADNCGANSQDMNADMENFLWGRNDKEKTRLRPVAEIPSPYQEIFSAFPYFNVIQSTAFDDVLYTDNPIVIAAPTGSGKTVLLELAIVKHLLSTVDNPYEKNYKIVYLAPIKALCEERLVDWHAKFGRFGVNCISVTGDSDNVDFQSLQNHNLIISTPEKWDSLTRRWRDNKKVVEVVKLFMLDEVHMLNEDSRGPTLEAVVSRMKTVQQSITSQLDYDMGISHKIRFMALSATIPNVEDVAEWLGKPDGNAKFFKFSEDMRPVKLKKIVIGYPYNPSSSTPFKFDIMLNYKLGPIILEYSSGKPTLIFCSTRKSAEMTSMFITQNLTITLNREQKQLLDEAASKITDHKIKQLMVHGVACHHAGIMPDNRRIIENLFRNGHLPILVTTSTLAMGVNLPAHLVIVKSTKMYMKGGYVDYSESAVFQMIGRAGRPQFDQSATAVILTTADDKKKYENMVASIKPIESNLHRHLTEHLNAEVVLNTITNLRVAMEWLTTTFLHVRAKKCPQHYGLPSGLSLDQIDKKLLELCQVEMNKLAKFGMLTIGDDVTVKPTETGILMAKYYLDFETMKLFTQISGTEILRQILNLVSRCHEFSEMYLRVSDKKCLNFLNSCRNQQTLRFPLNGKIKTVDMKINCIIQAVFGCMQILDSSLLTESYKIMRIGERVTKCLTEFLETKRNCFAALLNSIILAKCFVAHLWENSPHVCKQLSGIGLTMSNLLVASGKTTFAAILESNPRDLERIINRKSPMGNTIIDHVRFLPQYQLVLKPAPDLCQIMLEINLINVDDLKNGSTVNPNSTMNLLVGDTDNRVLLHEKYTHAYMIENPNVHRELSIEANADDYEVSAHFISDDWVGFDCSTSCTPKSKMDANLDKNKNSSNYYTQQCLELYMKKTKTAKNKESKKTRKASSSKSNNDEELVTSTKKTPTPPGVLDKNSGTMDVSEIDSDLYKCLNSALRRFHSEIFEQKMDGIKDATEKDNVVPPERARDEKIIEDLFEEDVDDDHDLPDEPELPPNVDSDDNDSFKNALNVSFMNAPNYDQCTSRSAMPSTSGGFSGQSSHRFNFSVASNAPDFAALKNRPNFVSKPTQFVPNNNENTPKKQHVLKQPKLIDFCVKTTAASSKSDDCLKKQNLGHRRMTENTQSKHQTYLTHFMKTPQEKLSHTDSRQSRELNIHYPKQKRVKLVDCEGDRNIPMLKDCDGDKDEAVYDQIDEIWGGNKAGRKSLTWRSPLVVTSPINKHSPLLNTSCYQSEFTPKLMTQREAILNLPLSDDQFLDSNTFVKPKPGGAVFETNQNVETPNNFSMMEDFVSTPLMNLIKGNPQSNVKKMDTPTDYYTKLKYNTPKVVKIKQNVPNMSNEMEKSRYFHSQQNFFKNNRLGDFLKENSPSQLSDFCGITPQTNRWQQNQKRPNETLPFFNDNHNIGGYNNRPQIFERSSEPCCSNITSGNHQQWPSYAPDYSQSIFSDRPTFCERKLPSFGSENSFREPFKCITNAPNYEQHQTICNCHHGYYKCCQPPPQCAPQRNCYHRPSYNHFSCNCSCQLQQNSTCINAGKDFVMKRFLNSVPNDREEYSEDDSE